METNVSCYDCGVVGRDWSTMINARSRGAAKAEYWRHVTDAWPDTPFTAVTARKVGGARTSDAFVRNAEYRGMPGLRCGQRVKVGQATGVVVGHNSSANLDVLFDADSPNYAGLTLNVHPDSLEVVSEKRGDQ